MVFTRSDTKCLAAILLPVISGGQPSLVVLSTDAKLIIKTPGIASTPFYRRDHSLLPNRFSSTVSLIHKRAQRNIQRWTKVLIRICVSRKILPAFRKSRILFLHKFELKNIMDKCRENFYFYIPTVELSFCCRRIDLATTESLRWLYEIRQSIMYFYSIIYFTNFLLFNDVTNYGLFKLLIGQWYFTNKNEIKAVTFYRFAQNSTRNPLSNKSFVCHGKPRKKVHEGAWQTNGPGPSILRFAHILIYVI